MIEHFKHKMRGKSPGVIIGTVIFGAIAISGLAVLFGFVIMWLWNSLMPEIFGLPTLSYFQAVGLFILSRILLSSGCGGGSSRKKHRSKHDSKDHTKRRFKSYFGRKCENEYSEWSHYDQYWQEEGKEAYKAYVERKENPGEQEETNPNNKN